MTLFKLCEICCALVLHKIFFMGLIIICTYHDEDDCQIYTLKPRTALFWVIMLQVVVIS